MSPAELFPIGTISLQQKEEEMYGYDGCYSPLQWLAITGNPLQLTDRDREELGLHELANDNRKPRVEAEDSDRAE